MKNNKKGWHKNEQKTSGTLVNSLSYNRLKGSDCIVALRRIVAGDWMKKMALTSFELLKFG